MRCPVWAVLAKPKETWTDYKTHWTGQEEHVKADQGCVCVWCPALIAGQL
ncbi:MAG: hypothetical protein HN742_20615 [Lentisphaerae bacterium]|nr:hypothetical protein [Lentisphaerota bacterium]MBT4815169.1 hypothetical protein [Lentisphaerota bacterium]MBT5604950.1 hypothetical protein [Lentisphaerota bacterium]MBT7056456.1 hypothetical protein [Lentisphaerota bacterium]MBT7844295.1 hypothetical protein [Lentisphaerota bacterium]